VKNGRPFSFELLYDSATFDPHLTVFQEDLRKVGIAMNLRLVTPETSFSLMMERRFETVFQAWGSILFPNPEHNLSAQSATELNTNNISGFKNPRVDELIKAYNLEFDAGKRAAMLREMDGIVANDYIAINLWYGPYQRILWWNRFGAPKGYLSRTGDFLGSGEGWGMMQLWWHDGEKEAKLQQALRDPSIKLDVGPEEDRYWLELASQRQQGAN
jgi:microcin C transport system substrate-binding protein